MNPPRWELLRALGAVADSSHDAGTACRALGLAIPSSAEHTEVFVLNAAPYASVYLGAEGGLGGEAADRVAGFWRVLGIASAGEPDHLSALLSLYASLGEAADDTGRPATRTALDQARRALLSEHLWSWLPSYLDAVTDLAIPTLANWAILTTQALIAEYNMVAGSPKRLAGPCPRLPLALRTAPPPLTEGCALGELLDGLTASVRSGMILTRRRLAAGAIKAGTGYRLGERRFILRAMLEQEPAETLGWLAREARRWQLRHLARVPGDPVSGWWAQRAEHTSRLLSREARAA